MACNKPSNIKEVSPFLSGNLHYLVLFRVDPLVMTKLNFGRNLTRKMSYQFQCFPIDS